MRVETKPSVTELSAPIPDRILGQAREYAALERLLDLDRVPAVPDYRLPGMTLSAGSLEQGESIAELERQRLHLGSAPIYDLFDLLEQVGIKVLFADLAEEIASACFVADSVGPCVVLNRTLGLTAVRFAAAHAFAHVLLDLDAERTIFDRVAPIVDGDAVEQRADAFAAALLLPGSGVERHLEWLGIDARRHPAVALLGLSEHFGTSIAITAHRLQRLGIADRQWFDVEGERSEAVRTRNGNVMIRRAPEVPHWSTRFAMLALLAYDRELISLGRLAELLDADQATIAHLVESRGLGLRQGPEDRAEAAAEVEALNAMRRR